MANIPSVNRTSYTYPRPKRQTPGYASKSEQSAEETAPVPDSSDRRRSRDRRRRNIQVLFNRRKQGDRRMRRLNRKDEADSVDLRTRKGRKINITV